MRTSLEPPKRLQEAWSSDSGCDSRRYESDGRRSYQVAISMQKVVLGHVRGKEDTQFDYKVRINV